MLFNFFKGIETMIATIQRNMIENVIDLDRDLPPMADEGKLSSCETLKNIEVPEVES